MNKALFPSLFIISIIVCSTASAGSGPDSIKLKTVVPFQHWKHQSSNGSECFNCHKADGARIENWGKEVAHELCISCHDLNDKGPVECKQCHR